VCLESHVAIGVTVIERGRWINEGTETKEWLHAPRDGAETIVGLGVHPLSASLEVQNRFTLANKSALQYGALAAAIGVTIFTLFALVVCIRTKLARRKWLWILLILIGFGKIMVNWTTGQWGLSILAVQLFSASATAEYFGPWIISVSLPIGAAIFLSRRRELAVTTD
jgi:hypothetical protein